MNHLDDNQLIDGLQAGLARRTAQVHAPGGLADDARRLARRRTTTRAVGAGVPVLASVGVATGLLLSSGGPTANRTHARTAQGPVAHAQETAYIVRRVMAKLAASHSDTLIRQYQYASGHLRSDGSLVNLGAKVDELYDYTASDGTEYLRNMIYQTDGSPYLTAINVLSPDGRSKQNDARTIINPRYHTYSQTHAKGLSVYGGPTPNLSSSPSQVKQALQSGQVTRQGTATINGTQAIALSIKLPRTPGLGSTAITLYVDAQTYQPLRTVEVSHGHPLLLVADWLPATHQNIARAKDDSIPTGYRKVDATY